MRLGAAAANFFRDFGAIIAAAVLWAISLPQVNLDDIGEFGLVTALPAHYFAALAMLGIGFVVALARGRPSVVLAAHVALAVIILHATAPLLYAGPRYSWAWKHVGVVDYILRRGAIDPTAAYLSANHNWPGFFALVAQLIHVSGLRSALDLASWAPLFFQGLYFLTLPTLFRSFTNDPRLIWLSIWLFHITNWVGQEYFSPQAFGYFLYLVIVAACLRWFRTRPARPSRVREPRGPFVARWWAADRRRACAVGAAPSPAGGSRAALIVSLLAVMAGLAVSHQISPVLASAALLALTVGGLCAAASLSAIMGLLTSAWIVYGAAAYLGPNLLGALEEAGDLLANSGATVRDLATASYGQVVVSFSSRALTAGILLMAVLGLARRVFDGRPVLPAAALGAVPIILAAGSSYGGEVLFRVYIFALPPAAFFAASLLIRERHRGGLLWWPMASGAASLLLFAAFMLAHFGKDERYRFTPREIDAAQYLYAVAPPGTLLIEGARNYPSQFMNYENFTYVSIVLENADEQAEILDDPSGVFDRWADNPTYESTYVIITRSQKALIRATGQLPAGALDRIEQALLVSRAFSVVYANADATVFVWNHGLTGPAP